MKEQLKVGDEILVGTGPDYKGFPAIVRKVISCAFPREGQEHYEIEWLTQGGRGGVDRIFATDWRKVEK